MAEQLTCEGLVLRANAYRETSRMLTLLTPEHGLMSVSAKGVMRPKNPLQAATEPFTRAEFVLSGRAGRYTLAGAHILDAHYALRTSIEHVTCAAYLRDLSQALSVEEEPQAELYALLCHALAALCRPQCDYRAVRTYFELHVMRLAGFAAQVQACSLCGCAIESDAFFSGEEGGVLCPRCRVHAHDAQPMRLGTVVYLQRLLRWSPEALAVLKSQPRIQDELQRCWDAYIGYHLQRHFSVTPFLQRLQSFEKQQDSLRQD